MAKFCAQCGAALEEGVQFCGECGAPVEQTAPVGPAAPAEEPVPEAAEQAPVSETASAEKPAPEESSQQTPDSGTEAPRQNAGENPAESAAPKEKKPLPKWVKPTMVAAAVLVLILAAAAAAVKGFAGANNPQKTVDKFLLAMEEGDLGALKRVAYLEDEEPALDEQTVQPMFRLYETSKDFRHRLKNTLEYDMDLLQEGEKPEGTLVTLVEKKGFLHTGYQVQLHPCTVYVSCAVGNIDVTLESGQHFTTQVDGTVPQDDDYTVYAPAYADRGLGAEPYKLTGLLPGLYDVSYVYDSAYGSKVEGKSTMEVLRAEGDYLLDVSGSLKMPTVYNDSQVDVKIFAGDKECLTIPGGKEGCLGPMAANTKLEARADVGLDEPMVQELPADESYLTASFQLCSVEIYNPTASTIKVYRGDKQVTAIDPYTEGWVEAMPSGTELEIRLLEDENVVPYIRYTCEESFGYLYAEFQLKEDVEEDITQAVETHVEAAVAAFNRQDMAALHALAQSELLITLKDQLEWDQQYAAENDIAQYQNILADCELTLDYLGSVDSFAVTDNALTISASYRLDFTQQISSAGDSYDNENWLYEEFIVRYQNGAWTVVDADID